MSSHSPAQLEILVTEPGRLDELLDEAEAVLRQAALCHRASGILVTRHDPARYTLTLSDTVPFGETREQILA